MGLTFFDSNAFQFLRQKIKRNEKSENE